MIAPVVGLLVGGSVASAGLAGLIVGVRRERARCLAALAGMQWQLDADLAAAIAAGIRPPLPAPADLGDVERQLWADIVASYHREDQ